MAASLACPRPPAAGIGDNGRSGDRRRRARQPARGRERQRRFRGRRRHRDPVDGHRGAPGRHPGPEAAARSRRVPRMAAGRGGACDPGVPRSRAAFHRPVWWTAARPARPGARPSGGRRWHLAARRDAAAGHGPGLQLRRQSRPGRADAGTGACGPRRPVRHLVAPVLPDPGPRGGGPPYRQLPARRGRDRRCSQRTGNRLSQFRRRLAQRLHDLDRSPRSRHVPGGRVGACRLVRPPCPGPRLARPAQRTYDRGQPPRADRTVRRQGKGR